MKQCPNCDYHHAEDHCPDCNWPDTHVPLEKRRTFLVRIDLLAVPGDRVLVVNYRSKNDKQEYGTVTHMEIGVNQKTHEPRITYYVRLDELAPATEKYGRERLNRTRSTMFWNPEQLIANLTHPTPQQ
jgi:uncharacterized protein YifN (PemK superfamily)